MSAAGARPAGLAGGRLQPHRRARAPSRRAAVQPHHPQPEADRAGHDLLQGGAAGCSKRSSEAEAAVADVSTAAARHHARHRTARDRQAADRAADPAFKDLYPEIDVRAAAVRPQCRHHREGPRHRLRPRRAGGFEPAGPADHRLPAACSAPRRPISQPPDAAAGAGPHRPAPRLPDAPLSRPRGVRLDAGDRRRPAALRGHRHVRFRRRRRADRLGARRPRHHPEAALRGRRPPRRAASSSRRRGDSAAGHPARLPLPHKRLQDPKSRLFIDFMVAACKRELTSA